MIPALLKSPEPQALTPSQADAVERVLDAAVLHEVGRARVRSLMRDPTVPNDVVLKSISYANAHEEALRNLVSELVRKALP
jgi:hypothetical protein